jgi:tRNA nucleotidyltransferase/poly(A) polymerase
VRFDQKLTHALNILAKEKFKIDQYFLKNAVKSQKPYKISHLDIRGNDLAENGIANGADIGKCLEKLLIAVLDGKVKNQKNDLLEFLKN